MSIKKRIDSWGCFYDLEIEAIEEARYKGHLREHGSYPQSWCVWCEEEREYDDGILSD